MSAAYDTDLYSWCLEQARLLRLGQWPDIDRENVAEKIESLGREQLNKLEGTLRVLLLRLLSWDCKPTARSRHGRLSIELLRTEIRDLLGDNPGLKPRVPEPLVRAYRKARVEAARETGLDETAFPETCPYSFEEALTRAFAP